MTLAKLISGFFALIFITGLCLCQGRDNQNPGAASATKLKRVDSALREFQQSKSFNGVVLIAENSKITFHKAYGYRDLARRIVLKKSDRFYFASISKTFVGVGIARLIEQGRIGLEDKMVKHLPELDGQIYGEITINQLLHHTSGLANDYQDQPDKMPSNLPAFSNEDLIDLYRRER